MKLFSFDVDGTILNSKRQVPQETKEALYKAKEKGHKLALCSGRSYLQMQPIMKMVKEDTFDFLICNNGTYVYDLKNKKGHLNGSIDKSIVKNSIDRIKKLGIDTSLNIHFTNELLEWKSWGDDAPEWYKNSPYGYNIKDSWLTEEEIIKRTENNNSEIVQSAFWITKDKIKQALRLFSDVDGIELHVSNDDAIDITPKNVNKFVGIQTVCTLTGIDNKNTISFGDSGNDLDMLEFSGIGYAMGNANDYAKRVADQIIGDKDTPAIANAILENI